MRLRPQFHLLRSVSATCLTAVNSVAALFASGTRNSRLPCVCVRALENQSISLVPSLTAMNLHPPLQPVLLALALIAARAMPQNPAAASAKVDPREWLEDVSGERALAWVRERNAESEKVLAQTDLFRKTNERILSILDSTARIPHVAKHGDWFYNFWQDAKNPKGLWRRTTLDEYRKAEPKWDLVLDLDALSKQEKEDWVWHGVSFLRPGHQRCLVSLSRGGADASVTREFDVEQRQFVKDGFFLPEAKGGASWRDIDSVFVATDFGSGSLTSSGYPRIAKLWHRGTPLSSAEVIVEAKVEDVGLSVARDQTKGFVRDIVNRSVTFFTNEVFLLKDGKCVKLEKPDSANASMHREWLLLELRDDWKVGDVTHPAGALLATKVDDFLAGGRAFEVLFAPTERTSLAGFSPTRNHILLNVLDNVRNRITVLTHKDGKWKRDPLPGLPEFGTIGTSAIDDEEGDDYFLTITDYLTPTSLWFGTIGSTSGGGKPQLLKSLPAFFDSKGLEVTQCETLSKDGTRIPYFLVAKKGLARNGKNPTLLYGYGGFEVSMTPGYSGGVGAA